MMLQAALGSSPSGIMRAGGVSTFDPRRMRGDLVAAGVDKRVTTATGAASRMSADVALFGQALGSDGFGRAQQSFNVPGGPTPALALQIANRLKNLASTARGLQLIDAYIVGGPVATLAQGNIAILRWANGIAVRADLTAPATFVQVPGAPPVIQPGRPVGWARRHF